MASIDKRPDGRYRARWREYPGGPQQARHFPRKADAERFLDGVRGDLARGVYIDPAAGRVSFGEYAELWRAAQVHRPTTAELVEGQLKRHMLPFFADRPIASIRPSEVQAWVKDRSVVLSPATTKVLFRFFSSILKSAVRDRLIATSPCDGVKLPKVHRRRVVPLETDAVGRLVEAMPPRYRALVMMACGTGMRQGEIFGLQVRHIDFLGRFVHVEQQLITASGETRIAPPKTPSSARVIPLPSTVLDRLAVHFEIVGLSQPSADQLIFTGPGEKPLRRARFGEVWRRAATVAALPPGTTFHDLRHYYASLLIRHGESVKVVQTRLGHASATETLDTYSHLWPDAEDRTRQAVDAVLGGLDSGEKLENSAS